MTPMQWTVHHGAKDPAPPTWEPQERRHGQRIDDATRQEIIRRFAAGQNKLDISQAVGVTTRTVRSTLAKAKEAA